MNSKEDDIEILCNGDQAATITIKAVMTANHYYRYAYFTLYFKKWPENENKRFVISKMYIDKELIEYAEAFKKRRLQRHHST